MPLLLLQGSSLTPMLQTTVLVLQLVLSSLTVSINATVSCATLERRCNSDVQPTFNVSKIAYAVQCLNSTVTSSSAAIAVNWDISTYSNDIDLVILEYQCFNSTGKSEVFNLVDSSSEKSGGVDQQDIEDAEYYNYCTFSGCFLLNDYYCWYDIPRKLNVDVPCWTLPSTEYSTLTLQQSLSSGVALRTSAMSNNTDHTVSITSPSMTQFMTTSHPIASQASSLGTVSLVEAVTTTYDTKTSTSTSVLAHHNAGTVSASNHTGIYMYVTAVVIMCLVLGTLSVVLPLVIRRLIQRHRHRQIEILYDHDSDLNKMKQGDSESKNCVSLVTMLDNLELNKHPDSNKSTCSLALLEAVKSSNSVAVSKSISYTNVLSSGHQLSPATPYIKDVWYIKDKSYSERTNFFAYLLTDSSIKHSFTDSALDGYIH